MKAALALAAAILTWQLLIPPVVGLANNGDFHKVLGGFSWAAPVADEYKYASGTYHYNPDNYVGFGYYSTEQLLAAIAIGLNTLVSKAGTMDLRFIGFVHGLLYLLAFRLLLPLLRESWFSSILVLLVFGDVMYVAELNSFYMDVPALLFFLLSAVFLCRALRRQQRNDALGFLACALCMIASKAQHAPLGLILVSLLALRSRVFLPGLSRWARVGSVLLLAAASLLMLKSTPWDYSATPIFSQVFYNILPRAKNPDREMRMLGLDESYRKYIGKHAYSEGSPVNDPTFARKFLSTVSYPRIGLLLLRRPGRAYDLLTIGLNEAGRQRPYLGNFDRGAGFWDSAESHAFSMWSMLKAKLFEGRGAVFLAYTTMLAFALPMVIWIRRARLPIGSFEAALALTAMMLAALLIAILGDPLDCTRHAWLFLALSDTAMVSLIVVVGSVNSEHETHRAPDRHH